MKLERLQKILAQSGIASRRAAETMIEEGRVRVNGKVVRELGAKADPRQDRIDVDGTRIVAEKKVYVVLHKPRGVVATMSDPEGRPTVKDYLERVGVRLVPVGRLDFATSGVLLATNDGDFGYALLHPKQKVPKTYVLKVSGEMQEKDLEQWRTGIQLDDGITQPAQVTLIRYENGKTWIELTITEGRNQMIRRMGEKTGFPVMRLARTSFADISSEGLAPGKWRVLDREELLLMKKKYGVPRSIPAMTDVGVDHRSAKKGPPRSDGRGRPIQDRGPRGNKEGHGSWPKKEGADAQHEHRPPRTDRFERKGRDERPQRGSAGDRPQRGGTGDRPQRGGRGPGNERHAGVPPRGRSPHDRPQEDRGAQRGQGQRSTGRGSPASRSASWKTDEPQREGYGLGRSGRSRTTGSGGGIGAEEGDYRMRRTRRG